MNFIEITRKVQGTSKKIYRVNAERGKDIYAFLGPGDYYRLGSVMDDRTGGWNPSVNDILAEDWEVFE